MNKAIKETREKVASNLLASIDDFVTNDHYDYQTDQLDFLEVKNSLVLSYLIDLTQLIRLQTTKKSSSETIDACVKRLQEMKVIMDKIRPMEKKMRYQIDKLLSLSATSSSFAAPDVGGVLEDDEINEEEKEESVFLDESDPLSYRPDPESMLGLDDNEDESDDDDEEKEDNDDFDSDEEEQNSTDDDDDDELLAAKAALNLGRKKTTAKSNTKDEDTEEPHSKSSDLSSSNIYKAPRMTAVPFEERERKAIKEEKMQQKERNRMLKSELLSTLKQNYGDAPEEDDIGGGATLGKQRESARRLAERDAEKTQYEEDTFVRLTTSRNDKKARNRIMREEISSLNTIADLGNLTAGVSTAFGDKGDRGGSSSRTIDDTSMRHANGKRKRNMDGSGNSKRKNENGHAKNSLQRELYGISGSSSNTKKKKNKKR